MSLSATDWVNGGRVVTEQRWDLGELYVWLLQRRGPTVYVLRRFGDTGGYIGDAVVEDNARIVDTEPSFRLPLEEVGAIASALAEISPPNVATQEHLRDVIGVRDRLLAMVEHVVLAP